MITRAPLLFTVLGLLAVAAPWAMGAEPLALPPKSIPHLGPLDEHEFAGPPLPAPTDSSLFGDEVVDASYAAPRLRR